MNGGLPVITMFFPFIMFMVTIALVIYVIMLFRRLVEAVERIAKNSDKQVTR
ncbi:hypothetical protein GF406_09060 [candidate division KSB1 bacterium]|nr:hypothetical protein [candidate division KSB1 bacterium]